MLAWSDERTDLLRKLVPEGHSYSIIAAQVSALPGPGISRNAAIGKATRLGIAQARSGRAPVVRKKRNATASRSRPVHLTPEQRALAQLRAEAFRAEPDIVVPPDQRRQLLDLEPGDCRWAYGNGTKDDPFYFCNRLQIGTESRAHRGKLPYCPAHSARAFDAPRPRRQTSAPTMATVSEKEPA